MDENQPMYPPPMAQAPGPGVEFSAVPVGSEPFYKRHGLAFAVSTLVLGIVVLVGFIGMGTVVAVNVASHVGPGLSHSLPRDLRAPNEGDHSGGYGHHDGVQRNLLRGTLESASGSSWTVSTSSGSTVTVTLTSKTSYGLPKQDASVSDFAVGDEVVVVGADNNGTSITATRILKLADFPRLRSASEGSGRA